MKKRRKDIVHNTILLSTSPRSNSIAILWRDSPLCNLILLLSLRIDIKNIRWITLLFLMLSDRGLSIWYIERIGITWTRFGNHWPICHMSKRPSQTFILSILQHLTICNMAYSEFLSLFLDFGLLYLEFPATQLDFESWNWRVVLWFYPQPQNVPYR